MVDLIVVQYDIKGVMGLGDVAASLEALNYQFNREVRQDSILKKLKPELEVVSITMASPMKVKIKPWMYQTALEATVGAVVTATLASAQTGLLNLSGQGPRPEGGYDRGQLEALRDFVKPLNGKAGNISIEGHDNSKVVVNVTINASQASDIRERALFEEKLLGLPTRKPFSMALLRVKVAVDETEKEQSGDKGIIPDLSPEKVKLSFASTEIKERVLKNPFHQTFMVSGEAEMVDGKPKTYRITELHEVEIKSSIAAK